MAKHTIDIIEGVKNFSQMKLFTINNSSEENISFSSDGLYPCIKVTKEEVQKYIEQNKFYYIHTYGEIYNLTDDIYGTIIVYNKEDNCYNIGILNMSSDIGMKGDIITFINLTKRINSDNEYWTPKYCFYNYESGCYLELFGPCLQWFVRTLPNLQNHHCLKQHCHCQNSFLPYAIG